MREKHTVASSEVSESENSLKLFVREKIEDYNHKLGNLTPEKLYVQCWYNVLRYGQKIKPHLHCVDENAYLSAHFTIQCDDTSTMYMNPVNQLNDPYIIEEKNKPGNFTIFPEYIPHFTTKHLSDIPRITMAMDIRTIKPDGNNWINEIYRSMNWKRLTLLDAEYSHSITGLQKLIEEHHRLMFSLDEIGLKYPNSGEDFIRHLMKIIHKTKLQNSRLESANVKVLTPLEAFGMEAD